VPITGNAWDATTKWALKNPSTWSAPAAILKENYQIGIEKPANVECAGCHVERKQ
jgi:hypothetical protein